MTAAFKVGERVKLVARRWCAQHGPGTEGVISYVPDNGYWVGVRFDGNSREFTPNPDRLVRVIDWTQPIELTDGTPLIATDTGDEHHVNIRLAWASYRHSAFPIGKTKGSARRDGGLVISNHKFYVRNRLMSKTEFKFQAGDRVVYVGLSSIYPQTEYNGRTGSVTEAYQGSKSRHYHVEWDDGERAPTGIFEDNLDFEKPKIDVTKPMQLPGTKREVTFVTMTSDGHILVDVTGYGWAVFDTSGRFVRAKDGYAYHVGIINKPVQTTEYIAVLPTGNMISGYKNRALAGDQNPEAKHFLRIDKTDGVVTDITVTKLAVVKS